MFRCLVMKKIEITIGDFFFCDVVFFINIDLFLEKIPGLETLVGKISDSISGMFLSNTFLSLSLCLIYPVFVFTALEVYLVSFFFSFFN